MRRAGLLVLVAIGSLLPGFTEALESAPSADETSVSRSPFHLVVNWQVSELRGRSLALPQPLTLSFHPQGTLQGSTGCNLYAAEFRAQDNSLRVYEVRRTQHPCASAEEREREAKFLALLEGARAMDLDDNGELVVYSTQGTLKALARSTSPPHLSLPGKR